MLIYLYVNKNLQVCFYEINVIISSSKLKYFIILQTKTI